MKILSWDVGIKNLAFCLIEVFPKNEQRKWSIKDWGIINLVDEGDRTCKCCKKNASLFLPCGGLKFCKIHSRKHELNIKQYNEYFKINQDKKQCCYLINSSKKNQFLVVKIQKFAMFLIIMLIIIIVRRIQKQFINDI